MSLLNNYLPHVNFYQTELKGTGYLAFRDLPKILSKYKNLKTILDFGCGAGRSSNLLHNLGFEVVGVDIDDNLLSEAKRIKSNSIKYHLIENNKIPFENQSFDIIFNSFVLLEIPTKEELKNTFTEMRRVCKNKGIIISIVNSDFLFTKKWLTIDNNFPQNTFLQSGDIANIYLNDVDIELLDFFWKEEDYMQCIKTAGLQLIDVYKPLGTVKDGYNWLDELKYPPYAIFICKVP